MPKRGWASKSSRSIAAPSTTASVTIRHSQSLEPAIAKRMGGIRCRYTGQRYQSLRDTHIEHIVALSEAHDSGLCAAAAATKRRFANDLPNSPPQTQADMVVVEREKRREKAEGRIEVAHIEGEKDGLKRPIYHKSPLLWVWRDSSG